MATRAITDSHAVAAHLRAALRPRDRRRALRRRGAAPTGHRRARAARPRAAPLRALRRTAGAREQPHLLVEAWARIRPSVTNGMKLVVVGGAPYASDYITRVRRAADPRVIFPGYVFGPGYWELQRNAYLFCAPTEVGGTHPVILEALAAGQLRARQRLPAQRRDGRRRGRLLLGREGVPDLARAARAPARPTRDRRRATATAGARAGRALLVGRRRAAYEQLLLEVSEARATARCRWTASTSSSAQPRDRQSAQPQRRASAGPASDRDLRRARANRRQFRRRSRRHGRRRRAGRRVEERDPAHVRHVLACNRLEARTPRTRGT